MFRTRPIFVPGSQPVCRGFGRTGGGFVPTDLGATLLYWGDTSQIVGLSNNDPATLPDFSGNGNDAVLVGGDLSDRLPTYITAGPNSLPTLRFDGNDRLGFTSTITLSSFTFFAVLKCTDGSDRTVLGGTASGAPQLRISSNKPNLLKGQTANIGSATTSLSTSDYYVVAVTYDGTDAAFFLNGSADGTATSAQTFTNPVALIGDRGGESYLGDIAEILICDSVLNGTNLGLGSTYLTTKYAL
jgi:hypothetical protein